MMSVQIHVQSIQKNSSIKLSILLCVITLLNGCATTTNKSALTSYNAPKSSSKILVMPIDVELSVLTTSGLLEPRADWTDSAKSYMENTLTSYQIAHGAQFVKYQKPQSNSPVAQNVTEVERLHSAVGLSILLHEYIPVLKLPSKAEKFDWGLGPEVKFLKENNDADYALFLYVRDSYSSGGRILLTAAAALLGVGIQGGQQIGFSSLVDLNTGQVVWFNRLFSTTGDMRTQESASNTVALLLEGLPE